MSFFGAGEAVGHQVFDGLAEDDYGNTVESWADPVEIEGVGLDVQTAQELTGSQVVSTSIVGMTAFMPPDWQGSERDRIIARGVTYEIDGKPVAARNAFTGDTFGVIANLKRRSG